MPTYTLEHGIPAKLTVDADGLNLMLYSADEDTWVYVLVLTREGQLERYPDPLDYKADLELDLDENGRIRLADEG